MLVGCPPCSQIAHLVPMAMPAFTAFQCCSPACGESKHLSTHSLMSKFIIRIWRHQLTQSCTDLGLFAKATTQRCAGPAIAPVE